jgi:glyoxylase-like metal-dependent hydrolase (beta-lactamase superfamily II)
MAKAKVFLSADEEPMITRKTPRFGRLGYNAPIRRPYTLLRDGEAVEIGGTAVRAIATPST